jgi:hypothetical protein
VLDSRLALVEAAAEKGDEFVELNEAGEPINLLSPEDEKKTARKKVAARRPAAAPKKKAMVKKKTSRSRAEEGGDAE